MVGAQTTADSWSSESKGYFEFFLDCWWKNLPYPWYYECTLRLIEHICHIGNFWWRRMAIHQETSQLVLEEEEHRPALRRATFRHGSPWIFPSSSVKKTLDRQISHSPSAKEKDQLAFTVPLVFIWNLCTLISIMGSMLLLPLSRDTNNTGYVHLSTKTLEKEINEKKWFHGITCLKLIGNLLPSGCRSSSRLSLVSVVIRHFSCFHLLDEGELSSTNSFLRIKV